MYFIFYLNCFNSKLRRNKTKSFAYVPKNSKAELFLREYLLLLKTPTHICFVLADCRYSINCHSERFKCAILLNECWLFFWQIKEKQMVVKKMNLSFVDQSFPRTTQTRVFCRHFRHFLSNVLVSREDVRWRREKYPVLRKLDKLKLIPSRSFIISPSNRLMWVSYRINKLFNIYIHKNTYIFMR